MFSDYKIDYFKKGLLTIRYTVYTIGTWLYVEPYAISAGICSSTGDFAEIYILAVVVVTHI